MYFDKEMFYYKRYPSVMGKLAFISRTEQKAAIQYLCNSMGSEPYYEPIPEREEKTQEFIALVKKFSEEYEIDIDISRTPYSVEASLHLYCGNCNKNVTRQFVQLFSMCDNLSISVPKSEPSDFTLVLKCDTHKFYLSGMLMND